MQVAEFKPRSGALPSPHDKAPLRGLCFFAHFNPRLTPGAKKDAPSGAKYKTHRVARVPRALP
jgi:hypothetical protein